MAEVDLQELERYLRIFQENPDSRVFAPLADLYRRLAKLDEAESICREGIRRHPYYAGGRVALAHILLDRGNFKEALIESDSVVTYYPDNLLARKILIRVLGGMGEVDRAQREYQALRQLAPMVASDPDVERALQGPSALQHFPESPSSALPHWENPEDRDSGLRSMSQTASPLQSLEKTRIPEWTRESSQDLRPALERSQRLAKRLRKKIILESLRDYLQNSFLPAA